MRRGSVIALLSVVLLAVPVVADASVGAVPDRVPLSEFESLPPASSLDVPAAARSLRERLLGPRALDPRYVTLHWVGVSSFVVTVKGHLLLFDAWEIVGAQKDYLPLGREELAGLAPEAILIGHGHFDHAADAGYVAGRTGAPVLASEEQCDTIKEDAARDANAARFTCAITGTQDSPAFGNLASVRLFGDLAPVTILKNVHSNARPPGGGNEPDPFLPVLDPTPYLENPNTSPEELARFLETLGDAEGGTRMYHPGTTWLSAPTRWPIPVGTSRWRGPRARAVPEPIATPPARDATAATPIARTSANRAPRQEQTHRPATGSPPRLTRAAPMGCHSRVSDLGFPSWRDSDCSPSGWGCDGAPRRRA